MRTQSVCLALAIVLLCPLASAQWVQTTGPFGGYITCVAASGANLFAGTYGGVFLSSNGGTSWTLVNAGLTNTGVRSLVVFGGNVFAGTSGGVFRSTNNGSSWTAATTALPGNTTINTFAVVGRNLYAGTAAGIFVSSDSGATWVWAHWAGAVYSLVASPNGAGGMNFFAGTPAGICVSTDNGANWAITGLTSSYIPSVVKSGVNIFAGTAGGGVFISTDNGMNWKAASDGLMDSNSVATVNTLAVQGTNIFAGVTLTNRTIGSVSGDVFRSSNNGVTWKRIDHGLFHTPVWSLAFSGTSLVAGTDCGVFESTDNGETWRVGSAVGNPDLHISALLINGPEIYASTEWANTDRRPMDSHYCIYQSTDNGDSWVPQLPVKASAFAMQGGNVFAVTVAGVYRTVEGGGSWTLLNEGLPKSISDTTPVRISCLAPSGQKLFAGTSDGAIYVTTDGGVQWTPSMVGMTTGEISTLAVTPGNVFAAVAGDGIFMSTNSGRTWTAFSAGLPDVSRFSVNSFAVTRKNVFAAISFHGVYRLDNVSGTWTATNQGLPLDPASSPPSYQGVTFITLDWNSLFASSEEGGFYLLTSSGASWRLIDSGTVQGVSSLGSNDTYLYAAGYNRLGEGGSGLWRRPKSQVLTSTEMPSSSTPLGFALYQNYPNPFNPSTTIQFTIPVGTYGRTSLRVYDVLGREVATLVNEVKQPGTYTVQWDASGYANGVYFYRMNAGSFVEAKKLVILK